MKIQKKSLSNTPFSYLPQPNSNPAVVDIRIVCFHSVMLVVPCPGGSRAQWLQGSECDCHSPLSSVVFYALLSPAQGGARVIISYTYCVLSAK